MTKKLSNYLRMYRMRTGLTEEDVAFLLGYDSGSKVSRYEKGNQLPALKNLIAYELIFGIPLRLLFAGIATDVEAALRKRAEVLSQNLAAKERAPQKQDRLAFIRTVMEIDELPGSEKTSESSQEQDHGSENKTAF